MKTQTETVVCWTWGVQTVLVLDVPRMPGVALAASRRWPDGSLRPVVGRC